MTLVRCLHGAGENRNGELDISDDCETSSYKVEMVEVMSTNQDIIYIA